MTAIGLIPARHAATRFPGKPLAPIAGVPMVRRVWEGAKGARSLREVIVATDDERVAEACRAFGARVAMTRSDHATGTDRLAEVAAGLDDAVVVNIQGDEPLVDPKVVAKLASTMSRDRKIEMITSASVFTPDDDLSNPNMVKVVLDRESNGLYFSRSPIPYLRGDGVKPAYYRHQGLYGYTTKFLLQFVKWKPGILEQAESLEQLRALENGVKIRVVLAKHAAVSVDTPEDVLAVEKLLSR